MIRCSFPKGERSSCKVKQSEVYVADIFVPGAKVTTVQRGEKLQCRVPGEHSDLVYGLLTSGAVSAALHTITLRERVWPHVCPVGPGHSSLYLGKINVRAWERDKSSR